MPRFFAAVIRPMEGPEPGGDAEMHAEIDALNEEMEAAGVRIMAAGLGRPTRERTARWLPDGSRDEDHPIGLPSPEHLEGFWIIEAPDMAAATEWARKGARACRAVVEVRQFL